MVNVKGVPNYIVRFVRSLPVEVYSRFEVAETLGVSPSTLKAFADAEPALKPSYETHYGRVRMYLYTPEDLEAVREFLEDRRKLRKVGQRVGHPVLWDADQLKDRRRQRRRVASLERRAGEHRAAGEDDAAAQLAGQAQALREALVTQYDTRFAEVTRAKPCE